MSDSSNNKDVEKQSLMKYYSMIGSLKELVYKSASMKEALQEGFKKLTEICDADIAIVWYEDKEGDKKFHPYYWIGPYDFTGKSCDLGDHIISNVFKNQNSINISNYNNGTDGVIDEIFEGCHVSSLICQPFSDKIEDLGCILLAKTDGRAFSDEQIDVCEIFSMFLSIEILENEKFAQATHFGNVMLSARNIKKQYVSGDVITKILKGVNLDVYEGEFLTILGESGCGKSTFLNIIGGMDQADEGSLVFMDKDISHASQDELTKYRRENIGFIFQSYNLMPNLTAKQNVDLIAELVDEPMATEDVLKIVGLEERANNYPSQMSGGQQQRVSIARALVKRPKLIFADEPTAALDYTTSIEVLEAMEHIVKQGTTLVMVTHNEEITRMADRVVRMKNGQTYEVIVNRNPVHAKDLVW